ncbi:hypothetical protein AC579_793 [Pseudocercospora musae]|uniref:Uncharacterized protein n=1 Tax=Pseudocercospora musae TaxID=113226 RepID=A0A139IHN5_9PEZI|nr:hypothetical protein AC579_793 [Pseudocercospora musae]
MANDTDINQRFLKSYKTESKTGHKFAMDSKVVEISRFYKTTPKQLHISRAIRQSFAQAYYSLQSYQVHGPQTSQGGRWMGASAPTSNCSGLDGSYQTRWVKQTGAHALLKD